MKVMKSNSMMISVQCQTEFSKDIWAKYSWSFSQGNHVRLQHKEDVVHAKQAPFAMPKVTIQQMIQPLHIKLALQHLSFSQLAVYKQQLLRESSEAITILQASSGSQAQSLQHTQLTKIVDAPNRSKSEAQIVSRTSTPMTTEEVNHTLQVKQSNVTWQQVKHVSQHFKQDRFLQAIMDKRSTAVHYHQHMQQIDNVAAHPYSLESVAASERSAIEQTAAHLSDIRTEYVKQPAQMVWHERVEARQQQWKQEQEAVTEVLQKQIRTHSENIMNASVVQRVTQTAVQRLVHQDLMRYISSQHIKVSTNQIVQLKKLSIKDIAQKELKRIEQRLSKEHITLHYAEHTVRRKRGRPKKENNQLVQERQADTDHINRKRKMASVLSRMKDEPSTNRKQLSNSSQQIAHTIINKADEKIKHTDSFRQNAQLPTLTEQRIISVSELWLNKVKSKQQLTSLSLIHLTKQVSDITGKHGAQASTPSTMVRQDGNTTMQGSNMKHRSNAQASAHSNIARQDSNMAQQSRDGVANIGNIAPQASNAPKWDGNVPQQASAQEFARSAAADAASGQSANEDSSDSNALSKQEHQLEEQSSGEVTATWRVNQQLQAKIEHVHVQSSQWLKHSITKHMKLVLASDVQAEPLSHPNKDNEPALQAKWQQKKLASHQTVLLTKLQERMKVRQQQRIDHEVITLNSQQAVIIHTQSRQLITLKNGHSVSLSTLSHKWGTKIQKLASPDRQNTFMQKAFAQQSLMHKEQRHIQPSSIIARKLLRTDVILQGIEKQHIEKQHILKTIVTPFVKPLVRQHMAILHKENGRLPAILKPIQRTQVQPVDIRQAQQTGARQVDRAHNTSQTQGTPAQQDITSHVQHTGVPPVSMSQAQQVQAQRRQTEQVNTSQVQHTAGSPVSMSQAQRAQVASANTSAAQQVQVQRAQAQPANVTQIQRTQAQQANITQAQQVDLHQAVAARTNMTMASHLSHAKAAKPMRAETTRQDAYQEQSITQPLSLKRVELDTVKKHVSLLVKNDHKGKQKQNTEPIAVMQTHIKKLEEQIVQQQQQLQDIRNPIAIKQLSNQIYAELSRKIKFDNQRLGR